jgi:hypothetical protein
MRLTVLTDYLWRKICLASERRQHILQYPEMVEWVDKIDVRRQRRSEKLRENLSSQGAEFPYEAGSYDKKQCAGA